ATAEVAGSVRRLGRAVPRLLRSVKSVLFGESASDAGATLQACVIVLYGRPPRQIHRCRDVPVEHGEEIGVADRESLEEKLAAVEIPVEVRQAALALLERARLACFGELWIEEWGEERFVQLRADEAQPLLQAGAVEASGRRQSRRGKPVRDVLQDGRVFREHLAAVGAQDRHQTERIDGEEVATIEGALGLRIDLDEPGRGPGLVKRDARAHRAGEGREIKIHGSSPGER